MRRREFIAFVGCTAAAWPLPARGEQSAVPVIGFLNSASPQPFANYVSGFRVGLKQTGYVDGQNVTIEFRWAEGHYDRLPEMAADLVRHKVAVLVSTGGTPSVTAAKAATVTIPIVFTTGSDPVRRLRHQPQPARRQRDWCEYVRRRDGEQAAWLVARAYSGSPTDRCTS
jgi:ABC-type uncharacterized transport system substrate-binding protein